MATQEAGPDPLGIATRGQRSSGYPLEANTELNTIYGPNDEFLGSYDPGVGSTFDGDLDPLVLTTHGFGMMPRADGGTHDVEIRSRIFNLQGN